ncbi:sporulation YhaL family protein [Fictibacillus nanhaiensis]|uniref:sporulation YhaL family protein n=1 Tax=Fictibacillus nanhaiensis TaxID=742169 RepID=UPI001C9503D1|nr:sporulation YhaL family protein [Fictibacillus nanhaiensis]MBY6037983.1 sporulation YhaL family protein [Fictibacillus nanhaiensis]
MKGYAALFFGAILIAAFVLKEYSAGVSKIFTMTPWWMYFVLCGIIYSGFRVVTLFQEDRAIEQKVIEEEGKVYMKRIEHAKARDEAYLINNGFVEEDQKASGE